MLCYDALCCAPCCAGVTVFTNPYLEMEEEERKAEEEKAKAASVKEDPTDADGKVRLVGLRQQTEGWCTGGDTHTHGVGRIGG